MACGDEQQREEAHGYVKAGVTGPGSDSRPLTFPSHNIHNGRARRERRERAEGASSRPPSASSRLMCHPVQEEEVDAEFTPVIQLTEKVETKTHEEDEDVLFKM